MEMASGEGRKAGNRVRKRRRATEKRACGREETSGSHLGFKGGQRACCRGQGEGEGWQGPGEALSVAPGGPGRLPSSASPSSHHQLQEETLQLNQNYLQDNGPLFALKTC